MQGRKAGRRDCRRDQLRCGLLLAARRQGAPWIFPLFGTGPCIRAEQLPQIFIAYRRFGDRERDNIGASGKGLGLAPAQDQANLLCHMLALRSVPARRCRRRRCGPSRSGPSDARDSRGVVGTTCRRPASLSLA